jgi:Bromodomain
VSESEAPDYGEIVTDPMHFGRMKEKVEEGLYGSGSAATAALYRDFLLVFDNCRLYNTDESEVTEEASRILALVPEAYVSSCAAAQKKAKP